MDKQPHYHPGRTPKQSFMQLAGILLLLTLVVGSDRHLVGSPTQPAPLSPAFSQSYIIQALNMEVAQTAVAQAGGQITHQLNIINAVAADLTDRQYTQLASLSDLQLYENGAAHNANTVGTYVDRFGTISFGNNNGSLGWSTDWIEGSESDGPASGKVHALEGHLVVSQSNQSAEREFDLSDASSATLSFDYALRYLWDPSQYITLDISSDGGNSWAELDRFEGPAEYAIYSASYDLSAYNSANTRIRFTTSNDILSYQMIRMGNLVISLGDDPEQLPDSGSFAEESGVEAFNGTSYHSYDGSSLWASGWGEVLNGSYGEDGGDPAVGAISIGNGTLTMTGQNNKIMRSVSLIDPVAATLSLSYKRNFASPDDMVIVRFTPQAYIDPFEYQITGAILDETAQQITIDLTPYVKNGRLASISFETNSTFDYSSSFTIDHIEISYTGYRPDVDFPTLVSANLVHDQGITGEGVTVAVLDSGLAYQSNLYFNADMPDFGPSTFRIPAFYDAIQNIEQNEWEMILSMADDDSGHGTHMAGVIGSGQTNNENGRRNGIAPNVDILPVAAFDSTGEATYADVIRGIDWIVANKDLYNIRIINASFFSAPQSYYWEDPLNQAVMQAWQAGIVVVASAGNIPAAENHAMTIGAPGNVPYIITVGGMTDNYTPDDPSDDKMLAFSAMGPTASKFVKPDLVAPGGHIRSYMPGNSQLAAHHPHLYDYGEYFTMSGTSQSAAVVSGIVALMLDADPSLTPDDVKCRLMDTARATLDTNGDLAAPVYAQGAGMIDAFAAVNSSASGCANQGLDIAADLAGTSHYVGHVEWDDINQEYVIYNDNGDVIEGVSWSGGNGFMAGGNGFMAGGNGFMAGGNGFMAGGNGFMAGGNGFMAGGNGFMAGTTPWNASITWNETPDFSTASASMNTWIENQE